MSVYITGDVHGDFSELQQWCYAMRPKKKDIIVILGDVALNYFGDCRDHNRKKPVNAFGPEIFCVHGNHEMRPEDAGCYELMDWHGGKVWWQPEFPNLIFAKDGEIYELGGKTVIVLGGAYSVDKSYRLAHGYRWFTTEQPSDEIKKFAEDQLDRAGWKVDVVFSHTCRINTDRWKPCSLISARRRWMQQRKNGWIRLKNGWSIESGIADTGILISGLIRWNFYSMMCGYFEKGRE